MLKRIVFVIFIFLLTGMLATAFYVPSAEAAETIYIRADGSIDPSTAPISTIDNVTYRFTDDIYDKIIVDRSNIVIDGNGFTLNGSEILPSNGFELGDECNVTIKSVHIINFTVGIRFFSSCTNNTISGNYIEDCGAYGIRLWYYSYGNVIDNNTISNCGIGFGIQLGFCDPESVPSYNIVSRNLITKCDDAIFVDDGVDNEFWDNTITNNRRGLFICEMEIVTHNRIYHNNFIESSDVHALNWFWPGSVNYWDNGHPSGGNYWDDYSGVDLYSGPNQDQLGSDGLGDTPYPIPDTGEQQDDYPLMNPIPRDIAVTEITPSKTVVAENSTLQFYTTVQNQGSQTEHSNITLYANETELGTQNITLTAKNSIDILFTWNTTGFPKGNYTIKAEADIVLGESDITDNNYVIFVIIAMIGDITGPDGWPDGKCDMRDIGLVAKGFGANRITNETDPRYGEYWHPTPCDTCPHSPNCDVVYDGKIDMKDIGTVSRHFGETDP